ncbi:MAG: HNH endonuclease [Candidatus Riflebacteria bacterium]|nr:HNH endonuclease [Candidatus Riflebacteria bacterium]
MDGRTARLVRQRAAGSCEYCRLHEDQEPFFPFHIEHIFARQHGGGDDISNLALSCHHDNLHKGTNLTGIDPRSRKLTRLFHPRRQRWSRHFLWAGPIIVGRTAVGRTTVAVLALNAPDRAALREALIEAGEFPPSD